MLYFYVLEDGKKKFTVVEADDNSIDIVKNQQNITKDLIDIGVTPVSAVLTLV